MGVFNKKNALIGWAVIEGARISPAGPARRPRQRPSGRGKPKTRSRRRGARRKALATAMGAAVAVGGVVALRHRKGAGAPGPEET